MFDHIKHQLVSLKLHGNPNPVSYNYDDVYGRKKVAACLKKVNEEIRNPKIERYLVETYKKLWFSERFSDFVVIVDNKEFKVHKAVLGIQSPVFASMFESDMEESKTGKLTIKDSTSAAVYEFLQFLYTGEFPDETNAVEIFELSSKYDVKVLKEEMEEAIEMNVDSENAIEILKLGNMHNSEILKAEAFDEVKLAYPELNLPDDMKNKPEVIELIMRKAQRNPSQTKPERTKVPQVMKF